MDLRVLQHNPQLCNRPRLLSSIIHPSKALHSGLFTATKFRNFGTSQRTSLRFTRFNRKEQPRPEQESKPPPPSANTGSPPSSSNNKLPPLPPNVGLFQRFKHAYKEYGKVMVAVYLATSLVTFGSFYIVASRYVVTRIKMKCWFVIRLVS